MLFLASASGLTLFRRCYSGQHRCDFSFPTAQEYVGLAGGCGHIATKQLTPRYCTLHGCQNEHPARDQLQECMFLLVLRPSDYCLETFGSIKVSHLDTVLRLKKAVPGRTCFRSERVYDRLKEG